MRNGHALCSREEAVRIEEVVMAEEAAMAEEAVMAGEPTQEVTAHCPYADAQAQLRMPPRLFL